MSRFTKFSFRKRIVGLSILSIIFLLTIFLPPLVNQYSEPNIERITISEHSGELELYVGGFYSLAINYTDTWHNVPISNATLSASSSNTAILEIVSLDPDSEAAGTYLVTILAKSPGDTSLTIDMSKPNYELQSVTLTASVCGFYSPHLRPIISTF